MKEEADREREKVKGRRKGGRKGTVQQMEKEREGIGRLTWRGRKRGKRESWT